MIILVLYYTIDTFGSSLAQNVKRFVFLSHPHLYRIHTEPNNNGPAHTKIDLNRYYRWVFVRNDVPHFIYLYRVFPFYFFCLYFLYILFLNIFVIRFIWYYFWTIFLCPNRNGGIYIVSFPKYDIASIVYSWMCFCFASLYFEFNTIRPIPIRCDLLRDDPSPGHRFHL